MTANRKSWCGSTARYDGLRAGQTQPGSQGGSKPPVAGSQLPCQGHDTLLRRDLTRFRIRVDPSTPAYAWADTLTLARAHSVPVDDAAYLELALRRKLPLATTDATLTAAATAAGVPILTP